MQYTFTERPNAAPYRLTVSAYLAPPRSVPKKPIRARTFSPLPTRMMPDEATLAMSSMPPAVVSTVKAFTPFTVSASATGSGSSGMDSASAGVSEATYWILLSPKRTPSISRNCMLIYISVSRYGSVSLYHDEMADA